MIMMTTVNSLSEFVDTTETKGVRVRTDAEKRAEALKTLVDAGIVRICDICGKPFRTNDPHRRKAKRCSSECKEEANRRNARERNRRIREERNKSKEVDMGKSDNLRALLDSRGERYETDEITVTKWTADGETTTYYESADGSTVMVIESKGDGE